LLSVDLPSFDHTPDRVLLKTFKRHAKPQTRLALAGGADDLYLAGVVQQSGQVLRSQWLVFDNNRSDPDPHGNKSYLGASSLTSEVIALGDSKLTPSRFRKGMRIVTVVPSPISLRASS